MFLVDFRCFAWFHSTSQTTAIAWALVETLYFLCAIHFYIFWFYWNSYSRRFNPFQFCNTLKWQDGCERRNENLKRSLEFGFRLSLSANPSLEREERLYWSKTNSDAKLFQLLSTFQLISHDSLFLRDAGTSDCEPATCNKLRKFRRVSRKLE